MKVKEREIIVATLRIRHQKCIVKARNQLIERTMHPIQPCL
jgi:hypothetical protein